MGRTLDNALLNVGIKQNARDGLGELGFRIEDVIDQEHDAALGNGGLGRLAACFLDSLATMNYPGWGYGLRYRYGTFLNQCLALYWYSLLTVRCRYFQARNRRWTPG